MSSRTERINDCQVECKTPGFSCLRLPALTAVQESEDNCEKMNRTKGKENWSGPHLTIEMRLEDAHMKSRNQTLSLAFTHTHIHTHFWSVGRIAQAAEHFVCFLSYYLPNGVCVCVYACVFSWLGQLYPEEPFSWISENLFSVRSIRVCPGPPCCRFLVSMVFRSKFRVGTVGSTWDTSVHLVS